VGASLASPCQCLSKPYRIKNKKKNSQFLRAAEAVGLVVPEIFKSPSFSKYNVFQIRRMRFAPDLLGLRRSTHFGLACGEEGRKQSASGSGASSQP
jgi:hypothetical protein